MPAHRSVHIGPVLAGSIPRLVAIIDSQIAIREIQKLSRQGATILEFRLDSFSDYEIGLKLLEAVHKDQILRETFGILATVRENEQNQGKRTQVFKHALAFADIIDVEFECEEKAELVSLAHNAGKLALLSSHDFNAMPDQDQLKKIAETAVDLDTCIYKIAATAASTADTMQLLNFIQSFEGNIIPVAIAMGAHGLLSRVAAPLFGSALSYGFIHAANAPGQLSLEQLHTACMQYYPEYATDYNSRMN